MPMCRLPNAVVAGDGDVPDISIVLLAERQLANAWERNIKGRWICEQGSPADERSVLNFITFH
jgi:hypothetical protein